MDITKRTVALIYGAVFLVFAALWGFLAGGYMTALVIGFGLVVVFMGYSVFVALSNWRLEKFPPHHTEATHDTRRAA